MIVHRLLGFLAVSYYKDVCGQCRPTIQRRYVITQSGHKRLSGRRVLLTNPSEGSDIFHQRLADCGAEVHQVALIQVQSAPFNVPAPSSFDWLLFTSKNGVNSFYRQVLSQNGQWKNIPVATVGPVTAQAVRQFGIEPQYVSPQYNAEFTAGDFAEQYMKQQLSCLWPCGNLANPMFRETLEQAGARVTPLIVYETASRELSAKEKLLLHEAFDLVVFTSPSAVKAYADEHTHTLTSATACLGPKTAQTATEILGRCDIQAATFTLAGLADAIEEFYETPETQLSKPTPA